MQRANLHLVGALPEELVQDLTQVHRRHGHKTDLTRLQVTRILYVERGQPVFSRGNLAQAFYILCRGQCTVLPAEVTERVKCTCGANAENVRAVILSNRITPVANRSAVDKNMKGRPWLVFSGRVLCGSPHTNSIPRKRTDLLR